MFLSEHKHIARFSNCISVPLRKKRDSNTGGIIMLNFWNFQEQWWLLLKYIIYYYVIQNYVGHKLVIFNTVLLLYCIYCYTDNETRDLAWLWQERTDRRNVFLKQKEVLLMLYNIDKNWYHFIKEYLE